MSNRKETALKVAEFLLKINAVKLSPEKPFIWASGWKSPIYCDNRISLSYPEIRMWIKKYLSEMIRVQYPETEVIAGVATAGIPQGVLVAEELGLPFIYVRSSPKDHGMGNLIEGELKSGQKVIVIEDLISTGSSSLKAVQALREAGAEVRGLMAIFSYGFSVAEENFHKANCPFDSLSNYNVLIEQALLSGYINKDQINTLKKWNESPQTWGA